jgi:hypothetical protein
MRWPCPQQGLFLTHNSMIDSQAGPYPALQGALNPVKSCL